MAYELQLACLAGDLQRVQDLCIHGVPLTTVGNYYAGGNYYMGRQLPILLISSAAGAGHLAVVQWLHTQKGLPLTDADNMGQQPIDYAASAGHLAVVQWLHTQGVPLTDADDNDAGMQPIHYAAQMGHLAVVRWLHTQGVPLNAADNEYGMQPIHYAAQEGRLDVVQWLHGQGVDVWAANNGNTALFWARDGCVTSRRTGCPPGRSLRCHNVVNWLNLPPPPPPQAPQPPLTAVTIGTVVQPDRRRGTQAASIAVPDLALGTLVIGDPGSGKTWLLKQMIASCAMQSSLKQIVVLDLKGDLTQMVRGMPDAGDSTFDECVDVRVYTLGTDMGQRSTLSPFNRTLELNSFDLSTIEGKRLFHTLATDVAADVLSGTVCLDKTGNARLEGGFDMPTRWEASGSFGVRASDDKKIASALIDSVRKVFFKCKEAGASVPTSNDELLRELNQADQPHVGGLGNDRKPARPIVMGPVTQEDLAAVKREIEVRMDPSGGIELLYQPIKGNEAQPRDDDVYPLDPSTFLGAREDGKRVKLSIINLALLGNGYGADTMRMRQHVESGAALGGATARQLGLL